MLSLPIEMISHPLVADSGLAVEATLKAYRLILLWSNQVIFLSRLCLLNMFYEM